MCIKRTGPDDIRTGRTISCMALAGISTIRLGLHAGWLVSNGLGKPDLALLDASSGHEAIASHDRWLSNCLCHLVRLLALDRFADYGSDQVRSMQGRHASAKPSAQLLLKYAGIL